MADDVPNSTQEGLTEIATPAPGDSVPNGVEVRTDEAHITPSANSGSYTQAMATAANETARATIAMAASANTTARATIVVALITALTFVGTTIIGLLSVQNARRLAQAELRAYVGADLVQWDKQSSLLVSVRGVNLGKTPAYRVANRASVQWRPHKVTAASFDRNGLEKESRRFPLAAGMTFLTTPEPQELSQGELQAILSGKSPLSAYGVIEYTDRFGSQHTTRYCFSYDSVQGDFVVCDENLNTAD